jgi:bifunctional UDP-N-acetylglucosamine pyrophosphorylase/glucosamine-1-phosphate N-acetyltransferase
MLHAANMQASRTTDNLFAIMAAVRMLKFCTFQNGHAMNVVILAAGMGKRMHSTLPKVLHPLAGKPLLSHVVDTARALSPSSLTVIYGHGGEVVPQALQADDLTFAKQEPQLGTGHAVMQAVPQLNDAKPTLILYGDVPLTSAATLRRLLDSAGDDKLSILTVEMDNPTGYGRIVRENGAIVRIVEQKDASEAEKAIREINTGIMVAPTAKLKKWLTGLSNDNAQREYYLTDIVASAVADGVTVASAQPDAIAETLGVNSKVQLAELERMYQLQQATRLLESGVTLADPARIDVRGELICGKDVSIDINCIFEGKVEIEDGASIGAHCVIKNARIARGAQIKPFCHIEDAVVGPVSQIGPYARLRPGTTLAEDVHIGNFVEVKNSQIAASSKANHLAYVGDATVGSRVNIGAGTITCNYDGANKFRTVIEDDAFIGSDSQLVAPVTVGKGATLGAGTTLTRNAPEGKLTVSRARQVTIDGWERPVKIKK